MFKFLVIASLVGIGLSVPLSPVVGIGGSIDVDVNGEALEELGADLIIKLKELVGESIEVKKHVIEGIMIELGLIAGDLGDAKNDLEDYVGNAVLSLKEVAKQSIQFKIQFLKKVFNALGVAGDDAKYVLSNIRAQVGAAGDGAKGYALDKLHGAGQKVSGIVGQTSADLATKLGSGVTGGLGGGLAVGAGGGINGGLGVKIGG